MHNQFRYLRLNDRAGNLGIGIEKLSSKLYKLLTDGVQSIDRQIYCHELAHSLAFVSMSRKEKLILPNFGWPKDQIGKFTPTIATNECRVFAFQYLLEIHIFGEMLPDLLSIHNSAYFVSSDQIWIDKNTCVVWKTEKSAIERIIHDMKQFEPSFKDLVSETVDYISNECKEFI